MDDTTEMKIKQYALEKRSKAYKWRYILARNIAIGIGLLFLTVLALLAWTLRGNVRLQEEARFTIQPTEIIVTEKI